MPIAIEPLDTTMPKRLFFAAALAGLLACAGVPAHADPVVDFTGGRESFVAAQGTFGWEFTVTSPVEVSALGIFDVGADGLADGHALGLWTDSGSLLRAVVITSANSMPVVSTSPDGIWRSIAVPALTLPPGNYVVGATYMSGAADHLFENATESTISGVTFDIAKLSTGPGLLLPSTAEPGVIPGYFGPNLFTIVTVPEPSSLFLLGAAMIGFAGRVAGKRRKDFPC